MKSIISALLIVFLLAFISCSSNVASYDEFSYSSDLEYYQDIQCGVKRDGFNNTVPQVIKTRKDVLELAKEEVTVEYNRIDVAFDDIEEVWRLDFSIEYVDGGNQSVYIDKNGLTLLIVYGE